MWALKAISYQLMPTLEKVCQIKSNMNIMILIYTNVRKIYNSKLVKYIVHLFICIYKESYIFIWFFLCELHDSSI